MKNEKNEKNIEAKLYWINLSKLPNQIVFWYLMVEVC